MKQELLEKLLNDGFTINMEKQGYNAYLVTLTKSLVTDVKHTISRCTSLPSDHLGQRLNDYAELMSQDINKQVKKLEVAWRN